MMREEQRLIRAILACMICLAGLLWAAGALGDDHPVNPYQAEVWEFERLAKVSGNSELSPRGTPVKLTCTRTPTLNGTGTWTAKYDSSFGTVREVVFYLSMKDYSADYTTVYYKKYSGSQTSLTSCSIVSGGSYRVTVYAKFGNMQGYYSDSCTFTVADDASHTSLTEKVSQVANSCRASSAWQTALNLHDWLVNNVYYDLNHEYYGADMILRGYGVCDGYSKAYCMLCKAAGVTVSRVTGTAGGSHAWNAIRVCGQWYYVDPTWDDPSGKKVAKSGSESHRYFCVNERILSLDHTNDRESFSGSCTSLDMNYYIFTNEWAEWGGEYGWVNGEYGIYTFVNQVGDAFTSGEVSCTLNQSIIWTPEGGWSNSLWRELIVAYGLERTSFLLSDGGAVKVKVSAGASAWPLTVKISGWNLTETGTLKLPANTVTVEAYAFEQNAATTVRIPSKCRTIGSRAFADSAVRTVYIPDSVTSIAPDAFDGCARIIFITNNQVAVNYAAGEGYLVLAP